MVRSEIFFLQDSSPLSNSFFRFLVLTEIFRVVVYYLIVKFLFSFAVSRDSFYRLSQLFYFVNHFFIFFNLYFLTRFSAVVVFRQPSHNIILIPLCQHYFSTSFPHFIHIYKTSRLSPSSYLTDTSLTQQRMWRNLFWSSTSFTYSFCL